MTPPRALERIPEYLLPYTVEQDPALYTPIDHAAWRFILKISREFFRAHAHQKYIDGLRETGISSERIPLISEMDKRLRRFGWRAVAVSGFIPPAVFMEFLSLGVLPIACDMRTLEHLSYTPAPDIVHEAAGHAPIIADPAYAEYLRHYGELSRKAIYSRQDLDVYQAIRALSDIKEDPASSEAQVAAAQRRLDEASAAVDHVSEATLLARMSWWTIEYGLVGDPADPKIYGAGLLSSVSESYHCFDPSVGKVPFDIGCVEYGYDITRPQPQLFVAPDFASLTRALHELGAGMAYRRGGTFGLDRARRARTVTTTVLEGGVSISGELVEHRPLPGRADTTGFVKYAGPVQIGFEGKELPGQCPRRHPEGFSQPIGPFEGAPAGGWLAARGRRLRLRNPAGIEIDGRLDEVLEAGGAPRVLTFSDCVIRLGEETLYRPEWGPFDLALGDRVVSVHGGPADQAAFAAATGGFGQAPSRQKTNLTAANRALNALYARVRELRESAPESAEATRAACAPIYAELDRVFPEDWLLRFELLELGLTARGSWPEREARRRELIALRERSRDQRELIDRGLAALDAAATSGAAS